MQRKNPYNLKYILGFLLFTIHFSLQSQTFNSKPKVVDPNDATQQLFSLCASPNFKRFGIYFTFNGTAFNAGNEFQIILSDPTGSFVSGTLNLGNINDRNGRFIVDDKTFDLVDGVYGNQYRIRIESTNPAMISEESDPFEAYFIPNIALQLKGDESGDENVVLCGSSPTSISLNTDDTYEYVWFFNGNPISGQSGSSLTVSQPGEYYAAIDAGACTDSYNPSNKVFVTNLDIGNVTIEGDSNVQICANDTYTLTSSVTDTNYQYQWYKDDEMITGATSSFYTTPTADQFGTYYLTVGVNGCEATSNEVVIQQQTGADFDVVFQSGVTPVILPGETIDLIVEDDLTSVRYIWFINDVQQTFTSDNVKANQPGVYKVVVTDTSGTCEFSKTIEIELLGVKELLSTIRTGNNYTADCTVGNTTLSIVGVKALATDDNEYDLSSDQIASLDYQWVLDGVNIAGATVKTYEVASYAGNGMYQLRVSAGSLSSLSDELPVLLTLEGVEIQSTSTSNKLCPGGSITFTLAIEPGFTYVWYKDNEEITVSDPSSINVTEVGTYKVTFEDGSGFCLNESVPEIVVEEFDASVLEVSPSSTVVLLPGETKTVVAIGADSYEWFDSNNRLLSTTEQLEVSTLGTYILIGRVGNCEVLREIQVVADDGFLLIPNIITPFTVDGVNDAWTLPNKYAFQPSVRVIIYDSLGKEVLNTTDYQNNWPENNNIKDGMLFYFKVIKDDQDLIKAGTISVLK